MQKGVKAYELNDETMHKNVSQKINKLTNKNKNCTISASHAYNFILNHCRNALRAETMCTSL
jgi:ABC-type polysaccharide/polyol phosphate transport system ATPase subunit